MPPQVGKAGDGARPVSTANTEGVQENQTVETKNDAPKNETAAAPHQASPKETASRKTELGLGAAALKSGLNKLLDKKAAKSTEPIIIQGTTGNDSIHVSKAPGLLGRMGYIEVNVNGKKQMFSKEEAARLEIRAGAGNDTVVIDANVKEGISVKGGSGNDVIIGGGGGDILDGGSGKDVIAGRGGDDIIIGGRGDDAIFGGHGNDVLIGGEGNDLIDGGKGNDVLLGGKGQDTMRGGPGSDFTPDKTKPRK